MRKSVAKTRNRVEMTIGITHPPGVADGLPASHQESVAIGMPRVGSREVKKALADCEIMASFLREYPKEMAEIANDVLAGRTEAARASALKIGLTEEAIQQQGGGMWVAIIFVGAFIFVHAAFSN